jgi:Zn-finger nucleic acid-binding protein
MICPACGKVLETHIAHSVEVEECLNCGGLWFDKGELRKAKDGAEPNSNWLDFNVWADQDTFQVAWSSRKCPICDKNMAIISYGSTGETIDYCLDGHGIWLDKGEFENIIAALENEINTMTVQDYIEASVEEAREIVTGTEGLISEWKDILTVTRLLQYRVLVENTAVAEALVALQSTSPLR